MRTLEEVMKYCEERSGVKLINGFFAPCGGGLYSLERSATKTGHHELAYRYREQRAELQLLMYELRRKDK